MENYNGLESILSNEKIRYDEPMCKHTTMRVGGKCDCMVLPTTIEEIKNIIEYIKKENIKYYIIGNGSNLLVKDEGVHRLIIKIAGMFNEAILDGEYLTVFSGCTMPKAALIARRNNLTGFEFACGIPGTVGGGVRMNAGAYDGELSNIVDEVTYLDSNSNICTIKNKDMKFSYRYSIFTENTDWIILKIKFKLKHGIEEEIVAKMEKNKKSRIEKQPLEYPSAGSVFTRPKGYFVGKLVQDSGLRGVSIGGAQVSEKHTGFIVNKGNATCADVLELIKLVQRRVNEKFGVLLKTEVIVIGGEE
ncbi:MAG: UDP-N-acetylmuramate dehydrogenase [Clostridia bacterium]